jgi:hypothetical protein
MIETLDNNSRYPFSPLFLFFSEEIVNILLSNSILKSSFFRPGAAN